MKTQEKEVLICGLDVAGIEELKNKHGFLILGIVKQGTKTFNAIFKEPDQKILQATKAVQKIDEFKGTMALYNNCIVKADPEIEHRDYLKMKVVECVPKHMQSFEVEVKNL